MSKLKSFINCIKNLSLYYFFIRCIIIYLVCYVCRRVFYLLVSFYENYYVCLLLCLFCLIDFVCSIYLIYITLMFFHCFFICMINSDDIIYPCKSILCFNKNKCKYSLLCHKIINKKISVMLFDFLSSLYMSLFLCYITFMSIYFLLNLDLSITIAIDGFVIGVGVFLFIYGVIIFFYDCYIDYKVSKDKDYKCENRLCYRKKVCKDSLYFKGEEYCNKYKKYFDK